MKEYYCLNCKRTYYTKSRMMYCSCNYILIQLPGDSMSVDYDGDLIVRLFDGPAIVIGFMNLGNSMGITLISKTYRG